MRTKTVAENGTRRDVQVCGRREMRRKISSSRILERSRIFVPYLPGIYDSTLVMRLKNQKQGS